MTQIIVTRGLPGSGKSTWAKGYTALGDKHVIVERDELRLALFNSYWTGKQEDEELVTRLQEELVRSYLKHGMSVIISDTHLPDRSVKKWLKLGHELSVPVEVRDFRSVPLETCIIQNSYRAVEGIKYKYVDPKVIEDKYNRYVKGRDLSKVVEYTPTPKAVIEPYVQPAGTRTAFRKDSAVIFDIDNTLAVLGDRSPYDGAKVHVDTLNTDVAHALSLYEDNNHTTFIVSGRSAEHREVTVKWLADNNVYYDALYMRPTGDTREDSIIKHELFNKYIRPLNLRILGVFDDRHRVLRMWRELGLTTFHVNGPDAGDF